MHSVNPPKEAKMVLFKGKHETPIGNPLYLRMSHKARAQAVRLKLFIIKAVKQGIELTVKIKEKLLPGVEKFLRKELPSVNFELSFA